MHMLIHTLSLMQCVGGWRSELACRSSSLIFTSLKYRDRTGFHMAVWQSNDAQLSVCLSVCGLLASKECENNAVTVSVDSTVQCWAKGHWITLFLSSLSSLPGLRPLMDVNYLPLTDMRIARTFCFTNLGQAMYLCSPTEIQRITYSQDTCENLQVS